MSETPEFTPSSEISHDGTRSGLAVAIPVIIATAAGVGALIVRKFRKKETASAPLTLEPPTE